VLEDRTLLSTYLVTNTGDNGGVNPLPGAGTGTLRQAIIDANANATGTAASPDLIQFNIPSTDPGHVYYKDDGVGGQVTPTDVAVTTATDDSTIADIDPDWAHSWWRIQPATSLPEITDPVVIAGYSQGQGTAQAAAQNTLTVGSNAVLRVELDASKMGLLGQHDSGVLRISAGNSVVRGLVIDHYTNAEGIELKHLSNPTTGQTGDNNRIQGNFIGTEVSGTLPQEQIDLSVHAHAQSYGVEIWGGSSGNVIGSDGTGAIDPGARNLISGNWWGVVLVGISWVTHAAPPSGYSGFNTVAGNYIGTDRTGMKALPNWVGVTATEGSHDDRFVGNLISGNYAGIAFQGPPNPAPETNALVTANWIGTDATGQQALPATAKYGSGSVSFTGNQFEGIGAAEAANTITIGGPSPQAGNVIAFNGGPGVWIVNAVSLAPGPPTGIRVQGNSIHDNGELGIDLGGDYSRQVGALPDGVTLNDSQGHTGPNNFQDFPIVTSTVVSGSNVTVSGTLNTSAGTAPFTVDVYASPAADPSYYGQGQYYLGAVSIPPGSSSFSAKFSTTSMPTSLLAAPWYISTTATDNGGNTSEFSKDVCIPVAGVTGPSGGVPGQPRTFTLSANASAVDQPAGFTFAINWGDGTPTQTVTGLSGVKVDHVYTGTGTFTMSVTATDLDGGTSSAVSQAISEQQVVMEGNSLAVGGTLGNDTITLTPADTTGDITVNLNGTTSFPAGNLFKPTDHILVYGQSGNDTIQLVSTKIAGTTYYITVPAFIYGGGTGKEIFSVAGSTANNVVMGGGGTNQITGGLGRDLLIAGLGASKLFAGSAGAILIGGWTDYDLTSTAMTYDKKLAALEAIMAEWGSTDSYTTRVNDLTSGGGLNGSYLLNTSTVHDNGQTDTLFGFPAAAPLDWFFAIAANIPLIKHRNPGEVITTIS
jgi:hypothetical protein